METKNKIIICITVLVLILIGKEMVFSEPGSSNDPLVTKSYVEKRIEELVGSIRPNDRENTGNTDGLIRTGLDVVELRKGQSIIGDNGTEIILRSGRAQAIGSKLGGLADITGGKDIGTGENIKPNHQLIIPRTDGRGVLAESESIYLVRGNYYID